MTLELDITRARVEPDALRELQACSRSHHLLARVAPSSPTTRWASSHLTPPRPWENWLATQAAW